MIYLDNAATTFPKPNTVSDEITRCIKKYCGNPGRSSHYLSKISAEHIYNTREEISNLFNAEAENVIFTYNTTYALNIAIKALAKDNTHILISDIEHNSVLRPVAALCKNRNCTYSIFSSNGNDDEIIEDILLKITPSTSLVVCTHVSNVGSRRLPIEKIGNLCHNKGIKFIVDGAQSAGLHHIDVKKMNIDALCVPGHKALYGPQGVGVIVFGKDTDGDTYIEGGTGINSLELQMPEFLPERYEAGTLSTPAIIGLGEGIKWLKSIGIDRIRAHEEDLYYTIKDMFSLNDQIITYSMNDYPGNTLLFNVKGMSSVYVSSLLDKRDVCVRSGFHCSPMAHKLLNTGEGGAVRVSFSVFNTKKEIYSFYDILTDIIKKAK